MKQYFKHEPWSIVEEGFHSEFNQISESIFSLGNGRMGQRGNMEETFSGPTLQGTYIAGVYYPDKTRVGWWKNGYPEYFAKVLNAPNWNSINVSVDDEDVDISKMEQISFRRSLNMRKGVLAKSIQLKSNQGKIFSIETERFISMERQDIACIKMEVQAISDNLKLTFHSIIDGGIINSDSNYDEHFWETLDVYHEKNVIGVCSKTKKTGFVVATTACHQFSQSKSESQLKTEINASDVNTQYSISLKKGESATIIKYVAVCSTMYYQEDKVKSKSSESAIEAREIGYKRLFDEHASKWEDIWHFADIKIEGDIAAQQGIRFNIFQLRQTYGGEDPRLNIGPKGFTGEKYGGSTYWDTEAYCLPFYLGTADMKVARNLLVYRYQHLEKAIENAEKLGFTNGAALYPMVTMTGEECHNEWEITFEEIHRNGAIAYAIFDYIRHSGDNSYLVSHGSEVLIAISRFWAQRVNWSKKKNKWVMLGVTGPNEYENNVNNNWYTNYIAKWCLNYTLECIDYISKYKSLEWDRIKAKTSFDEKEVDQWKNIINNICLPQDEELGIFLQQDGYLDKEDILVSDLKKEDQPINQNWSWDRILRSPFIKQADVLQGLYFFETHFDLETIRRNFKYYEPRTVHESSLSPCIHSILACRLSMWDKAYEMYVRTARLDLDDYNNDTEDGCHITSMAGAWLSIIKGFAGVHIDHNALSINPFLPDQWDAYSFYFRFQGQPIHVEINRSKIKLSNLGTEHVDLELRDAAIELQAGDIMTVAM